MKKRSVFSALAVLALLFVLSVPALAAVDLSAPAYVVDDAGVLSASLEDRIVQANQTLEYDCSGAQFVVVTVAYAPAGMDREEFAKEIFDTWNIGSQAENNGALLVVYTEDNDFWLECGYGIYNSPYVDEIADMVSDDSAFYRSIQKGDFESAVSGLLSQLTDWYADYYGSTANNGVSPSYGNSYGYTQSQSGSSSIRGLLVLVILVLLIVMLTSPFRCRRRWGHWGLWPFFYFSPWWGTRTRIRRMNVPRDPWDPGYFGQRYSGRTYNQRPGAYHNYSSRPSSGFGSRPSSSSSFRSGGGRSGGGFGGGGGRSGGSSFRGGGGHSGGGFGHR